MGRGEEEGGGNRGAKSAGGEAASTSSAVAKQPRWCERETDVARGVLATKGCDLEVALCATPL